MIITLNRLNKHQDCIDGQLCIEGLKICDTAENAHAAIPAGTYTLSLVKCKQYARKMPLLTSANCSGCKRLSLVSNNTVLPCCCPMLKPGNGVHNRLDGSIIVGERVVPGCLIHPKAAFDSLYDRIRKSIQRGGQVELIVSDAL